MTGTATLKGALNITTTYMPLLGDSVTVLTAAAVVDSFTVVSGKLISPTLAWRVLYRPDRVDLIAGTPPPNNKPLAVDDATSTPEDTFVDFDVLVNDSDLDLETLNVVAGQFFQPLHGSVALNLDGTVRYTPTADYFGPDEFQYTISDTRGALDTALVSVEVTPINDRPLFNAPTPSDSVTISVAEGTPISFTVTGADVDDTGPSSR